MKKNENSSEESEMLAEYDFTNKQGVRGKYHLAYQQGHIVRIYESDGQVTVHRYTPDSDHKLTNTHP